jgi:hypothetical protein
MWNDVKNKFHTAYMIILGLTILIAPWDIYTRSHSYKGTVYSLIVQPPHAPHPSYTVSISIDSLIGNVLVVSLVFGIVYFICKKFVYKH